MNIIQRFVPVTLKETRPGIKMVPECITIHETDNTGFKANAEAHARLQESGNSRQASWHMQVDDCQAIQSIPFDEVAWAAGDGKDGPGNLTSIHLEICVNNDGDYKKSVSNAAEVTKHLMKQLNIPLCNVVQHNKWSGKNCPRYLRSGEKGIKWDDFINSLKEVPKVPQGPGKEVGEVVKTGDHGESVKVINYQLAALGLISWADREKDVFGNSTLTALKKFQKGQRIEETGIYDGKTALQFAKVLAVYYQRLNAHKLI